MARERTEAKTFAALPAGASASRAYNGGRIQRMVEAARDASPLGCGGSKRSRLTKDYQLAFAEIKARLVEEVSVTLPSKAEGRASEAPCR